MRDTRNGYAKRCLTSSNSTACISSCTIGAALSDCAPWPRIRTARPASHFNTGLPVRDPNEPITQMAMPKGASFTQISALCALQPVLATLEYAGRNMYGQIAEASYCGYAAPYPNFRYLTGNRQFTQMLPTRFDNPMLVDNFRAREKLPRQAFFLPVFRQRHYLPRKP